MASYDRRTAAGLAGPVLEVLDRYWNTVHDIENRLQQASHEYDVAASYRGGPAERDAKVMMAAINDTMKAISKLADSGGLFDKLAELEQRFKRSHGTPEEYAEKMRDRIYPR